MKNNYIRIGITILLLCLTYCDSSFYSSDQPSDVFTVAIDAGHGGKDPGAISQINSHKEKEIVLSLSQQLKEALDTKKINSFLTRTSDRYISLENRLNSAKKGRADLFISIHNNNSCRKTDEGLCSYYQESIPGSKLLADCIHNQFSKSAIFIFREMKTANFYLLKESTVPTIILELGYINNQSDIEKLTDAICQQEIIEKLAEAIEIYKETI